MLRELLDEIAHQQRDVFSAFPQRRNPDREHVQAVEQIAAKLAVRDHLIQIAVSRCYEANIHFACMCASQPFKFSLLQGAQQLRLNLDRNISHFIQEQGALIGQFHTPYLLANGAGESSLFISKQFAFEQTGRNGGAVQLHEGALFAAASVVNGAGDQLLPRARLPEQEDSGISGSDSFHKFQNVLQCWAGPDDVLKVHLATDFFFEIEFFLRELVFQFGNFVICHRIFDLNGDVPRSQGEKFDIVSCESSLAGACNGQHSECSTSINQRNQAGRFQTFCGHFGGDVWRNTGNVHPLNYHWLQCFKNLFARPG